MAAFCETMSTLGLQAAPLTAGFRLPADTWNTVGAHLSLKGRKDVDFPFQVAVVSTVPYVNFKSPSKFIPYGFPGIR